MRLLDLFCGAGGAAQGYSEAGFDEVVGVDLVDQPNYPFEFMRADALELSPDYLETFDLIHASPPCQAFTAYRRKGHGVGDGYLDLVEEVRGLIHRVELVPYVIENVPGAPLERPLLLCGSMFGLEVRRHRLFECSFSVHQPECDHKSQQGSFAPATNRKNPRKTCEIGVWRIPLEVQHRAMGGCDWMTREELSQAVPPAYTRYIGEEFLRG